MFGKKKNKKIEAINPVEMAQRIESINKQFNSINQNLFIGFEQQKKLVKR